VAAVARLAAAPVTGSPPTEPVASPCPSIWATFAAGADRSCVLGSTGDETGDPTAPPYTPLRSSFSGPDVALIPSAWCLVSSFAAVGSFAGGAVVATALAVEAEGLRSMFWDAPTFAGSDIWGTAEAGAVADWWCPKVRKLWFSLD